MTAHLPVIGSSAKTTAFCSDRIDGLDGTYLYVDGNGKITAGNGTLLEPRPNAFSLPAQAVTDARLTDANPDHAFDPATDYQDCPGSTRTCRKSCYVGPLSSAQREIYALYEHNGRAIREILADRALADDWAMRMAHWITTNASGGFRWHVSGDVYSMQYAEWIADVCRESPTVRHWIYTRSFEFLAPLVGVATINGGNLSLNLSCDADNYHAAREAAETWTQDGGAPRLCYLTVNGTVPTGIYGLGPDDVIFPDYPLRLGAAKFEDSEWWQSLSQFQRGLVCPVDARGKAENRRCGPCSRCLK